jgi:eukaryotic-like serine/threonine-protein kinase
MREWLDLLGTDENSQPSVIIPPNTNPTWERNIQFWGVVIAAIAAFAALLAGIAPWIPILNPSSNQPSQSPSPSSTKNP